MYFKYYPMESKGLAIRDVDFVRVVELPAPTSGSNGYLLLPYSDERKCSMIDAAIQRLAALTCRPGEVMDRLRIMDNRQGFYDVGPVWNRMEYDDPWYDGLKWYETAKEANAEMERIAEAITRGERLYDLTKEATS